MRVAFAAVLLALSFLAAGCGGGGGSGGATADGPLSGNISILGPWSGRDQQSFEAVARSFTDTNPGVTIRYVSAGERLPARLTAAVERGSAPDVAVFGDPRLLEELADKDAISSLEFMKDDVEAHLGESAVTVGSVDGKLYGLLFKVINKSTVWYNPQLFQDGSVRVPRTWKGLTATAAALSEWSTPAYSIGGADGWTLADLFDNVYLRTSGPSKYDELSDHKIPWTDESVKTALSTMAQLFRDKSKIAGDPLQVDFEESISSVISDSPKAGMVFGPDFAPNVVDPPNPVSVSFGRVAGTDYNVFAFPSIDGSQPMVVGDGDTIVAFNDKPATKAFMDYLATTEAAQIWLERGGFASLNKEARLAPQASFPDVTTKKTAGAVADATAFRFSILELEPRASGGSFGKSMGELLQDLLAHPGNVENVSTQLEEAAKKAYD